MRVKLLTDRATMLGPAQREGDEIEVPDAEGAALIRTNQAVECAMQAQPETTNRKHKPSRR